MKICGKCGQKVQNNLTKCNHCGFIFKHDNNEKTIETGKKAVKGVIKTRSVVIQTIFFPVIALVAYISVYMSITYGIEFFKNINKNKEVTADFIEIVECDDEFEDSIICDVMYKYIVNDEEYIIYDEGVSEDSIEEKVIVYYNENSPHSGSLLSKKDIVIIFLIALVVAIIFVRLFFNGVRRLLKLNDIVEKNK